MNPICLTLILLAPDGPAPPKLKGTYLPLPLASSVSDLVKASLRELRGSAVVVVEDEFLLPLLPKMNTGFRFPGGRLRLTNGGRDFPVGVPAPAWMNGESRNAQGKVYPIGWGY